LGVLREISIGEKGSPKFKETVPSFDEKNDRVLDLVASSTHPFAGASLYQ
jgi:hypothetical protein